MSDSMRLDKFLSNMGVGTRSEVKKYIGWGRITVNGKVVRQPEHKVNPHADQVAYKREVIPYEKNIYLMMNKPQGVISATADDKEQTVLDLVKEIRKKDLFPVGRLDKDTEGLLVLTNDGPLGHALLSPRHHVPKGYRARIQGQPTQETVEKFKAGVVLEDGYKTLPAELTVLASGPVSEIHVVVVEGKYHQIKRMFEAVGMQVLHLQRVSMGGLRLDPNLPPGSYRPLTPEEVIQLQQQS
ncbi:pseudouridine synthase [Anaerotalea alkaliphila]|uniref:Pseudouridine synthase n=1 Tax=Anaerotalea alkaliphila TaxID=2662126 RepID=A0A7X5KMF6_9FIRM|nr:pseudouridine synthase [Anaerotalea alkaliphila]NDL66899.1 rRNA pseudouridine synthase [Anaerotalea alkaliphila]